jgi:hypothetical protein
LRRPWWVPSRCQHAIAPEVIAVIVHRLILLLLGILSLIIIIFLHHLFLLLRRVPLPSVPEEVLLPLHAQ